jgi:formylglycine-generating enzyme required for sulfatase activity
MLRRFFCVLFFSSLSFAGDSETVVAGDQFRDCELCPLMIVIPAGASVMGTPVDEPGRLGHEGPLHEVSIAQPFAVGKFEITFAEWDACVAEGGCNIWPADEGWGRGQRPVVNINMDEMGAFLHWLSRRTGHIYRLLSEIEWEYVARAGSRSAYPWGDAASHDHANFGADECCSGADGGADQWKDQTAPVGSFPPNAFGLHDLHGNVYERVQDCWNPSYENAPDDGRAWLSGDCRAIGLRGGSWISSPELMRSGERDAYNGYYRVNVMGFRVARELN